eukprot:Blabericola_migrator_1__4130@NODE_225_length_11139_cov_51_682262_g191_i0_p3_GENE_NODE_225_length_11139_cov_51_682262_g191_i0NODE_225_length_11139_cov_51_682262_g191_i0_p3_ORF_typecomplete_len268_score50_02Fboxlike/PF12937_7/0_17_NODE_225_length_11139_cov_51_682262_g191_i038454648
MSQVLILIFPFLTPVDRYRVAQLNRRLRSTVYEKQWELDAAKHYLINTNMRSVFSTLDQYPFRVLEIGPLQCTHYHRAVKISAMEQALVNWHMMCVRAAHYCVDYVSSSVTRESKFEEMLRDNSSHRRDWKLMSLDDLFKEIGSRWLGYLRTSETHWCIEAAFNLSIIEGLTPVQAEAWNRKKPWELQGPTKETNHEQLKEKLLAELTARVLYKQKAKNFKPYSSFLNDENIKSTVWVAGQMVILQETANRTLSIHGRNLWVLKFSA